MSDLVQQHVVHVTCAEQQRSVEELNLVVYCLPVHFA